MVEKSKAEIQAILNDISVHAAKLHDLMKVGTTIDIVFILEDKILLPNQPPKLSHLLLVKPEVFAEVKLTPKLTNGDLN
jgi:hypothetical protein